jgi:hypothetical protein
MSSSYTAAIDGTTTDVIPENTPIAVHTAADVMTVDKRPITHNGAVTLILGIIGVLIGVVGLLGLFVLKLLLKLIGSSDTDAADNKSGLFSSVSLCNCLVDHKH